MEQLPSALFPSRTSATASIRSSLGDLAAVLMKLDLVVNVDTAVAHVAGALGVPVWVLLPVSADWRWLLERSDSPWYPTMRLYRQSRFADWDEVLRRVAADLRSQVASTGHNALRGKNDLSGAMPQME